MKTTLLFLLLSLSGCASTGVFKDDMQPDGSYRIYTGGNAFASAEAVKARAYQQADALCPNGYEKKAEGGDSAGIKSRYQLIVKCN